MAATGSIRVSLSVPPAVPAGRWTVRLTAAAGGATVKKSTAFYVAAASGSWVIVKRR